jgi:uncharacterized protein (DUF1697 family)
MTIYISMIRGINVGGKSVKMADLRDVYLSLDLENVKTYIQSGNVVFKSENEDPKTLSKKIQQKILDTIGYDIKVVIRTIDELKNIIKSYPFEIEEEKHVYITFLSDTPDLSQDLNLKNWIRESEKFIISSSEIYLYLPHGYGRTKLNNNFFEKKLKLDATTRNWKTVNKLCQIAESINGY